MGFLTCYLPQLPHHAPGVSVARSLALLCPFESRPVDPVRRECYRQLAETSTAVTTGWLAPSGYLATTPPPLEQGLGGLLVELFAPCEEGEKKEGL